MRPGPRSAAGPPGSEPAPRLQPTSSPALTQATSRAKRSSSLAPMPTVTRSVRRSSARSCGGTRPRPPAVACGAMRSAVVAALQETSVKRSTSRLLGQQRGIVAVGAEAALGQLGVGDEGCRGVGVAQGDVVRHRDRRLGRLLGVRAALVAGRAPAARQQRGDDGERQAADGDAQAQPASRLERPPARLRELAEEKRRSLLAPITGSPDSSTTGCTDLAGRLAAVCSPSSPRASSQPSSRPSWRPCAARRRWRAGR